MSIFHFNLITDTIQKLLVELGLAWVIVILISFIKPVHRLITKIDEWIGKKNRIWILAGLIILAASSYYIVGNVLRYEAFQLNVYDFGIYDQMVWKISHFQPPNIPYIGRAHWLGDHFQPILLLIAPLYWIWNSPYVLMIIEPIILFSGIIPIILLSKKWTNSYLLGVSVGISYALFPGVDWALRFTFHPSTLVPAILLWSFYLFDAKKWIGYFVLITIALMAKEDVGLYVAFYAIVRFIISKTSKERYILVATLIYGGLWSYLAIHTFIPFFRQGPSDGLWDPLLTQGVGGLLGTIQHDPSKFIDVAFNTPNKWTIVLMSFTGFGLLPALHFGVIALIPFIAERALSGSATRVILGFHYGAPIICALAYTSILAASWMLKKWPQLLAPLIVMLLIGTFSTIKAVPEKLLNIPQQVADTKIQDVKDLNQAIKLIPPKASVSAQDSIAVALSHRNDAFLYDGAMDADYIVIDSNLSYWPIPNETTVRYCYKKLLDNKDYGLIFSQGTVAVFRKNVSSKMTISTQLSNFIYQ